MASSQRDRKICDRSKPNATICRDIAPGSDRHASGRLDARDAAMARDHRKLDVFTIADHLAIEMYRSTADFPASERFGMQSQLRRAAVSIPTNVVEGCSRDSDRDYVRFLEIAFGSAREVIYLTSLARRLAFMNAAEADKIEELARRTAAALAALKKSIRLRLKSPKPPKALSP